MELPAPPVRCRPVVDSDLGAVLGLLVEGFPARSAPAWATALERLRVHHDGMSEPQFGHLLERDGEIGGVILSIPDRRPSTTGRPRRNLSSWYVRPELRSFAPLLVRAASRAPDVTYVNISPEPGTRRTIEALGFARYGPGVFLCVPILSRDRRACRVLPHSAPHGDLPGASSADMELVRNHADLGCVAFWCVSGETAHPFVFMRRPPVRGVLPCAQLVFCADTRDVVTFAGSIGRRLLGHGYAALSVDAEGPVAGLLGRFVPGQGERYFKGRDRPRLGDLAYSEAVLFGL